MTEGDYIVTTNLAKLRCALGIMRDLIPHHALNEGQEQNVRARLSNMVQAHEARVHTEPDDGG